MTAFHLAAVGPSTGSSHSILLDHNDWISNLARTVRGFSHPNGSNSCAAALTISRFVMGFVGSTLNLVADGAVTRDRVSDAVFQGIPKILTTVDDSSTRCLFASERRLVALELHDRKLKPPDDIMARDLLKNS